VPKVLLRHVNLGFGLALFALLLIGVVSFLSIRALIKNSDSVAHTQEVMAHAAHVG
jgi:CHASE3 domain sensor protein